MYEINGVPIYLNNNPRRNHLCLTKSDARELNGQDSSTRTRERFRNGASSSKKKLRNYTLDKLLSEEHDLFPLETNELIEEPIIVLESQVDSSRRAT
jgi:hypothetical protein